MHFKAPLDIDIIDLDSGFENKIALFTNLNPLLSAPGRVRSFWGRVAEEPENVILATTGVPPTIVYIDAMNNPLHTMLAERTSITTFYFRRPMTPEQKALFLSIKGLAYGYSGGTSQMHLRASRAGPCKGWVDGNHEQDGRVYEMGIIWHFWMDADRERDFKLNEKVRGRDLELSVVDKYVRDLEEAGAEKWTEVHCDFECLPNRAIV
ncbi:MAG: hypothetical protein Q9226_004790 [Calogaya cf. arnoldii]